MNFYGVGGLLVRRRMPVRRGVALEMWSGDQWVPYADIDAVLRHGRPLTETQALDLIVRQSGELIGPAARLSEQEARHALRAAGSRVSRF